MHNVLEFGPSVGNAAAGAAEGVCGAHDQGQAHFPGIGPGGVHSGNGGIGRLRLADVVEKVAEILPILGFADGFQGGAEETDVVPFQDAGVSQGYGQVQPGLAAQSRQDALRLFPLDNALDDLYGQRLDINPVGNVAVGHNSGRVGVDQNGGYPFLAQGFAGLGAGVVKLGGLADDDGAGADYQDFVQLRCVAVQGRFFLRVSRYVKGGGSQSGRHYPVGKGGGYKTRPLAPSKRSAYGRAVPSGREFAGH